MTALVDNGFMCRCFNKYDFDVGFAIGADFSFFFFPWHETNCPLPSPPLLFNPLPSRPLLFIPSSPLSFPFTPILPPPFPLEVGP